MKNIKSKLIAPLVISTGILSNCFSQDNLFINYNQDKEQAKDEIYAKSFRYSAGLHGLTTIPSRLMKLTGGIPNVDLGFYLEFDKSTNHNSRPHKIAGHNYFGIGGIIDFATTKLDFEKGEKLADPLNYKIYGTWKNEFKNGLEFHAKAGIDFLKYGKSYNDNQYFIDAQLIKTMHPGYFGVGIGWDERAKAYTASLKFGYIFNSSKSGILTFMPDTKKESSKKYKPKNKSLNNNYEKNKDNNFFDFLKFRKNKNKIFNFRKKPKSPKNKRGNIFPDL